MKSKLVWWGAEPPSWLAGTGEVALVRVPPGEIEQLLGQASAAKAVLLDTETCGLVASHALAFLKAAHVPTIGIGRAPTRALDQLPFADTSAQLKTALDAIPPMAAPLRLRVEEEREGEIKGRVISGQPKAGMPVALLPDGVAATIAACDRDVAAQTTTLRLEPRLAAAHPAAMLVEAGDRPEVTDQIAANVIWVDSTEAMLPGRHYVLDLAGQEASATVTALKYRLKPETQEHIAARRLSSGELGLCNLSFSRPVCLEAAARRTGLGAFLLKDSTDGRVLARGFVEFGLRRATNVHWQALSVDRDARAALKGQRPCCLWFTGLSGSGKSTVASLLERRLHGLGRHTYVLDGDNVRHGLNRDLGFTDADRVENIRRVAEVAKLMADAGLIVMVSFISPFRAERNLARRLFEDGEFLEVYLDTPIEVCEARDPKGLYKKARAGLIKNFTGIDSAYEPPESAELRLPAAKEAAEALVERILAELTARGLVPART